MGPGKRRFEDDAFAPSHLPMARKYPPRPGRGRLYAAGALAFAIAALPFLGNAFFGDASSVSSGALSENHALFGRDCASCHTPGEGTPDAKCRSCHETAGDPMGSYGFARHYLYRSGDFDRTAPGSQEVACASCHAEHRGSEASLRRVVDAQCASCHEGHDFRRDHPEFEFAAEPVADAANLHFTHVYHVREVADRREIENIEATCLMCHEPEPDGRSFQPISFARHCDECHFKSSTATPPLPLASADGRVPGVRTVEAIRRDPAGLAAGADYWDPGELRPQGGPIIKRPVYHADPWVLYNLGRLRSELYPGAALAELLRASSQVAPGASHVLIEEAVATLRGRIQALHGLPSASVQDELNDLEDLLEIVTRRLEDPYAPVDVTQFDVQFADRAPSFEPGGQAEAALTAVVDSLTAPCQSCHIVERATIARVQKDQRTLVRAEFDHSAHIIHSRCLDCHTTIPVRDWATATDDPPTELDSAPIQNLPAIANCRGCHERGGAPDRCTTCHVFHPDKSHWSNLSRSVRASG